MSNNTHVYSEDELFDMANDFKFYQACFDFYNGAPPLQRNPVQTIGDRMRLIKCLEKEGFKIIKIQNHE